MPLCMHYARIRSDDCSPTPLRLTVSQGNEKSSVSKLASEAGITVETTVSENLGELTVENNDDGNGSRANATFQRTTTQRASNYV